MKKLSQILAFQLIILTLLVSTACSKRANELTPEAVIARNAEFDQTLSALSVDIAIDEFHRVLGEPASQKRHELHRVQRVVKRHAPVRIVEEEFTYIEYLYVNDHFYVQAVADEEGKVGMYSITARTADYTPSVPTILDRPVQLGKSTYADFAPRSRKMAVDFSKNRDKPAYYEVIVKLGDERRNEESLYALIATNPLGHIEKMGKLTHGDSDVLTQWFSLSGHNFPLNEEHGVFRQNTTINTYTTVASWFRGIENTADGSNFSDNAISIGPHAH
jgi:hypothetical protein